MSHRTPPVLNIELAGKSYTIQALTIGQLEALHVGIVDAPTGDNKEATRQFWARNCEILAAALSEDHPELTVEALRKLRLGTVPAVNETVRAVLRFAGLAPAEEGDSPGERAAGAE